MTQKDYKITEAMETYGGHFVVCLARAARAADASNLAKLKKAFPEYWKQYEEMAG